MVCMKYPLYITGLMHSHSISKRCTVSCGYTCHVWISTEFTWPYISMGWCKKDVTILLKHWSYIFLALTHWYVHTKLRHPDSKVHGANMGPTWVLAAPDGPHVGPMNLAMRAYMAECDIRITEVAWMKIHTRTLQNKIIYRQLSY